MRVVGRLVLFLGCLFAMGLVGEFFRWLSGGDMGAAAFNMVIAFSAVALSNSIVIRLEMEGE